MNEHMMELGIINHTGHCFRVGYIVTDHMNCELDWIQPVISYNAHFIINLKTCEVLKRHCDSAHTITNASVMQMFRNLPLRSLKEVAQIVNNINCLNGKKRNIESNIRDELIELDNIHKALLKYD
jgi:hypothetical protein